MQEMVKRIDFYHEFHPNVNHSEMLAQAELFFDKQQYTLNVVDVCVSAAANALEINLHIYQKLGKKVVIIQ